MNLNGTEYYYIKSAQGDIIGLFDSTGTQVVSYTYDIWGKLISTSGSLASTVGASNPYRYKGYRYDYETGLYYLQSRYYNPDWGRFINADVIAASTGELLSGNMFAYCKNNPVSMSDADGDRPDFSDGSGRETQEDIDASLSTMSKVNTYNYAHKSSFSVSESVAKNTRAATMDKAASKGARQVVSVTKKWVEEGLATVKYVESPRLSEVIKTKGLGSLGSIGFTAKDIITSISNKQYAGACMDLVSGAAGIGAGMVFEAIGVAILATFAAPEILVGAGVVAAGIGVSMFFDYAEDRIKKKYYGGN